MSEKNSLPKEGEVYQLRLFLKGISPLIWRRLLVIDNSSLADLHHVIQITMGWEEDHLHQFDIWGKKYGLTYEGGISFSDNARKVYLRDFQFRLNETFVYEYDFFCNWEHEIRLEKKVPLNIGKLYPVCTGGGCLAPPEDCGGPLAFMRLKDHYSAWRIEEELLEALEDGKSDEDYGSFRETAETLRYWLIRHTFDLHKTNKHLQDYFNHQEKGC